MTKSNDNMTRSKSIRSLKKQLKKDIRSPKVSVNISFPYLWAGWVKKRFLWDAMHNLLCEPHTHRQHWDKIHRKP